MAKLRFYFRREWLNLVLGTLLTLLLMDFAAGPLGARDLVGLRAYRMRLVLKRDHLPAENATLKEHIARLRSDDAYLERLIRQELGYARPGELVYRFSSWKSSRTP